MSLGAKLERGLQRWRRWRRENLPGALGTFYREGGEAKLWDGLPLGSADVVLDVGGYQGSWTAEVLVRYGCRALVFEPVPDFFRVVNDRYAANDRVRVFREGLAGKDAEVPFFIAGDGSSVFPHASAQGVLLPVVDVARIFEELRLDEVGCMKINIEGGEFELFERMIRADLPRRIRCFLVQFHRVEPDSGKRRDAIHAKLAETHKLVYQYPFVWERWDRMG